MLPFRLTNKAKEDLISIARYTERTWGRDQRILYLRQLDSMFHTLSETPELGRLCEDIKPGYYKHLGGSHLVFYRVDNDSIIEIIRVLHKRMDVAQHL